MPGLPSSARKLAMVVWILLALQFAATALGLGYLWARQGRLSNEVARLRAALAAAEANRGARVARVATKGTAARAKGGVVSISETPQARAARTWRAPATVESPGAPMDTLRGLALGTGAAAPLLGLLLGIDTAPLVAVGIGVAALMMLLSLRPQWQAAAWPAAITATAWALIGLTLGAAQALPAPYSVLAVLA